MTKTAAEAETLGALEQRLVAGLNLRLKDMPIGDANLDAAADGRHLVAAEQPDEVDDRLVAPAPRRKAVQLIGDEAAHRRARNRRGAGAESAASR